MLASEACNIPELGEACYNEKGMTNKISLSQMPTQYRETYNSKKGTVPYTEVGASLQK